MTAEKIIERIVQDTEKEVYQIIKEAENTATGIINDAKKIAEQKAEIILNKGEKQSENIKKILISKASQDVKREIIRSREEIIDECFTKAHHKLSTLSEKEYEKIVTKLIDDGRKKLDGQCTLIVSRDKDKIIAEKMGFKVSGTVEVSGGVILKSSDGRVTLDHTFDGILKREKDKIRIKVGKLLFSK